MAVRQTVNWPQRCSGNEISNAQITDYYSYELGACCLFVGCFVMTHTRKPWSYWAVAGTNTFAKHKPKHRNKASVERKGKITAGFTRLLSITSFTDSLVCSPLIYQKYFRSLIWSHYLLHQKYRLLGVGVTSSAVI